MKRTATAALLTALTLGAGTALAQQKSGMDSEKPMSGSQASHIAHGVVKKLDPKAGSVTIVHEPVKSLQWPAMTMSFVVRNPALFDKLTVGRKLEFEFVQDGRRYVVTGVK